MDILGNGWNISEKGVEIITENNTVKDKGTILKNALNSDFKEISTPVLTKIQNKNNISQVVLQIQKIRNISAPKANENSHAAPRMLKLVLTDGESYIQAIETSPVPSLNLDKTSPGSKILIKSAKLSSGYLLLDSNNCSLLGGKVTALYEKWELAKSVQGHNRQTSSTDGPPAWVNFGSRIQSDIEDKSFKSLDKNQEIKENTKFDLQRQDAIAEATSGAVKKVFGGGIKQPGQQQNFVPRMKPDFQNRDRKISKNKTAIKEVDDKPQKPSERVSLFDFLEDKLPANDTNAFDNKSTVNRNFPRVQNNSYNSYVNKGRSYQQKTDSYQQKSDFYQQKNDFYQQKSDSHQQKNDFYQQKNDFYQQKTDSYQQKSDFYQQKNDFYQQKSDSHQQKNDFYQQKNDFYQQKSDSHQQKNDFYHQKNDFYQQKSDSYQQRPENPKRNDFKFQPPQSKVEENFVNGLSNNLEKMSLNTQFASRSLKQHLNLGPQKKTDGDASAKIVWKIGDDCVAKYWEDGKFYNASITAVTDKTCVVKFKGYGNMEEVLKNDCFPVVNRETQKSHHSGPVVFRRSANTYRT